MNWKKKQHKMYYDVIHTDARGKLSGMLIQKQQQ